MSLPVGSLIHATGYRCSSFQPPYRVSIFRTLSEVSSCSDTEIDIIDHPRRLQVFLRSFHCTIGVSSDDCSWPSWPRHSDQLKVLTTRKHGLLSLHKWAICSDDKETGMDNVVRHHHQNLLYSQPKGGLIGMYRQTELVKRAYTAGARFV